MRAPALLPVQTQHFPRSKTAELRAQLGPNNLRAALLRRRRRIVATRCAARRREERRDASPRTTQRSFRTSAAATEDTQLQEGPNEHQTRSRRWQQSSNRSALLGLLQTTDKTRLCCVTHIASQAWPCTSPATICWSHETEWTTSWTMGSSQLLPAAVTATAPWQVPELCTLCFREKLANF